ncbi:MAG: outer membrane beta-barrel protein [Bacteroidaceae bacterium]|nr:outer membrane beta-barrel protein [Bacteroidaceae bacterium]
MQQPFPSSNRWRQYFLALFAVLFSTFAHAQQHMGQVVDANARPLAFASVEALSLPDSAFVQGAVTDAQGRFSFAVLPREVALRVRLLGYATTISKAEQWPVRIVLSSEAVALGEAVVRGGVPTYRLSDEGIVTKVEGSMLASIGDATDVLQRIPAVRQNGSEFEVFGRGNALVYVNGRRLQNLDELKSLPSDQIISVEVINHPGVRYSATTNAVIRIRTKRPVGEGLGLRLRSSYYQGENADFADIFAWNYRQGAWDVFGQHSYHETGGGQRGPLETQIFADTLWQQSLHQDSRSTTRLLDHQLGFNYQPSETTSAGLRYTFRHTLYDQGRVNIGATITANGQPFETSQSEIVNKSNAQPYHYLAGYYYTRLGKVDWQLDITYVHRRGADDLTANESDVRQGQRQVQFHSTSGYSLWASRLAASWTMGKSNMTLGSEWTKVDNQSSHQTPQTIVANAANEVHEQQLAAFAEWTWTNPLGRLTSGLRYETIWYDQVRNGQSQPSTTHCEWFPSLRFGTKVGRTFWQMAYSYRTFRPSFQQLNQSFIYANRFTYQRSNPLLDSEHVHDLSLTGSWWAMQFGVNFKDRRDAIVFSGAPLANNSSIIVISPRNLSSVKSLSAFAGISITKARWQSNIQASLKQQWLSLPTRWGEHHYNRPIVSLGCQNTFKLSTTWKAFADCYFNTKGHTAVYHLDRNTLRLDLAMAKSFARDRWNLRFGVTDLLNRADNYTTLQDFSSRLIQRNDTFLREAYVTLRYTLNPAKDKYKGKGAGENEMKRL